MLLTRPDRHASGLVPDHDGTQDPVAQHRRHDEMRNPSLTSCINFMYYVPFFLPLLPRQELQSAPLLDQLASLPSFCSSDDPLIVRALMLLSTAADVREQITVERKVNEKGSWADLADQDSRAAIMDQDISPNLQ